MAKPCGEYQHLVHTNPPVWNKNSKILILGSFPSVKSRETGFYYGHPQNRFWRVLPAVLNDKLPQSVEEKKALLISHGIALWDVIAECDIVGSADSSIKNVIPSDILRIVDNAPIRQIYINGGLAEKLYNKHLLPITGKIPVRLPSTSPANASWSFEKLCDAWKVILQCL